MTRHLQRLEPAPRVALAEPDAGRAVPRHGHGAAGPAGRPALLQPGREQPGRPEDRELRTQLEVIRAS